MSLRCVLAGCFADPIGRTVVVFVMLLLVTSACGTQGQPAISSRTQSSATATTGSAALATGPCSDPQVTTRGVIERLFQRSTSGDARAVNDCYAKSWRARHPDFDGASAQWAIAGPALSLQIDLLDSAKGCDRYRVSAQLTHGERVGWSGRRLLFFAVGPEGASYRIFEVSTALVRSDQASTTCE